MAFRGQRLEHTEPARARRTAVSPEEPEPGLPKPTEARPQELESGHSKLYLWKEPSALEQPKHETSQLQDSPSQFSATACPYFIEIEPAPGPYRKWFTMKLASASGNSAMTNTEIAQHSIRISGPLLNRPQLRAERAKL